MLSFVQGVLALSLCLGAPSFAQEAAPAPDAWTAREARHLLNRAAFGATPAELDAAVALGRAATIERLLLGGREVEPPFFATVGVADFGGLDGRSPAEQREVRRQVRERDKGQLAAYTHWWLERMRRGEDPLRDRMTLFWHGFFTTSSKDLRRTFEVIQQHQLLRDHALESYAELLAGIVHDPAMLYYLDNTKNKKGKPNENLARELLELFSLGEGNYTERDVQEVARALTGHQAGRDGGFELNRKQHDDGEKTILGRTGRFDAEDVVAILLEQDACARWVAGRLLESFEGARPDAARLDEYAACLREADYALRPFLRKLLDDPRFYRDEVVGARVLGPVDFLVSSERRLGLEVSPEFVYRAASELGQTLFQPPNVKGWEGGESWITTASLIGRGNAAGLMLGVLDEDAARVAPVAPAPADPDYGGMEAMDSMDATDDMDAMQAMDGREEAAEGDARLPGELRALKRALGKDYAPRLNLTWRFARRGLTRDAELAGALLDELLAIAAPDETRAALTRRLAAERAALGVAEGELLAQPALAEPLLRRLAHLVLSLPEAQLD
ncbi:MAG: DUF1800 domain-containing protein [Planctomycetes bacterium]|nr:DUF1800 domain-containing protein [Planctomycetota bacterium]